MSDSKFVLKDRNAERYIYSFNVHGIDFVKRQKYAKSYKTFDEAECAKMRIRKYDDVCRFVKNLADDVDLYKEDRKEINALVNEDMEGNFSEKILKIMGIKM